MIVDKRTMGSIQGEYHDYQEKYSFKEKGEYYDYQEKYSFKENYRK